MKKTLFSASFLLFCLCACHTEDKTETPGSDINVVSDFIKASLKGDYETAKTFMVQDSLAIQRMYVVTLVRLSPEEKKGLANASINIHNVNRLNDSTTIVIYSNSYKNNHDTLRAQKVKGKWLVDFNYYFDHDMDTMINHSINK